MGRPKLGIKVKMILVGIPVKALKQLRELEVKNISKFIRDAVEEKIARLIKKLERSKD